MDKYKQAQNKPQYSKHSTLETHFTHNKNIQATPIAVEDQTEAVTRITP